MRRLAIIEPHLSNYSCDTFMGLLDYCDLDFVFSPTPEASGFGSVSITNPRARCIVIPSEKSGNELGILFTGRLREGSNVALLARVIERFRMQEGIPLTLHIIGDGGEAEQLRKEWRSRNWLTFYGAVYEHARLREISLSCFVGCYPGNAGLSVVHMMSLSLPVLTHSEMQCHQGPEPSFVEDGISGMLFNRRSEESSLYEALRSLVGNREKLTKMQKAAYEKYQSLVDPPLAARLW